MTASLSFIVTGATAPLTLPLKEAAASTVTLSPQQWSAPLGEGKSLNTKYGHPKVEQDILPTFMRALEAHAFSGGHAYRVGDDEYVILLSNGEDAVSVLSSLQARCRELRYQDVSETVSLGIGLCVVGPDCLLSDQVVVERANHTMLCTKDARKNQISVTQMNST